MHEYLDEKYGATNTSIQTQNIKDMLKEPEFTRYVNDKKEEGMTEAEIVTNVRNARKIYVNREKKVKGDGDKF